MVSNEFLECLYDVFGDKTLFGFSSIDDTLSERTNCKCALVTLMPYPDLNYIYNTVEYFEMLEALRLEHADKLSRIKSFLDQNQIKYETPPATPQDDGNLLAEFSYKWAAIHAGLGFIGKNDVFVHRKYAQRVRISCLLIDLDMPVYKGDISSKCGECNRCVLACPHNYLTGKPWHIDVHREELIAYKECATKSMHSGEGQKYLCAHCLLACRYET